MQLSKSISRPSVAAVSRRHVQPITARFGGGNVMDRPDMEIKTSGPNSDNDMMAGGGLRTLTESGSGGSDRQRATPPGGGNYRVLLLHSPEHTETKVIKGITSVVPHTNKEHALNCYATSLSLGMAIVVSVIKEHAEMYSLQLYGMGLKTAIEPDTSVA